MGSRAVRQLLSGRLDAGSRGASRFMRAPGIEAVGRRMRRRYCFTPMVARASWPVRRNSSIWACHSWRPTTLFWAWPEEER